MAEDREQRGRGQMAEYREQNKSGFGNATSVASKQRTEQSKSGAIKFVCAVGNATSVASKTESNSKSIK